MTAADRVWFFGYGSLMWRPGFASDACLPATLEGYHRRFCITSRHYRGTSARPGLVLGLAPGGACVGRAFGVEAPREAEVLAYLDEREQVGGVYVYDRLHLPVRLHGEAVSVPAWCYVARPDHPDYAGDLPEAAIARRIAGAAGIAGSNRDYVANTLLHLRAMGIDDPALERLATVLEMAPP